MVMNPDQLRQAGNWLAQLKKILQLGPSDQRDFGNKPKAERRKTKEMVETLLANLKKGGKATDGATTDDDAKMIVFNAVDLLIQDKTDKSKENKTKLDALAKFETELNKEFAAQANKTGALDNSWSVKINEAIRALRQEAMEKSIADLTDPPDQIAQHMQAMLGTDEGKQALAAKPKLAAKVLSSVDPAALKDFDFDGMFGNSKNDVLAGALVEISTKFKTTGGNIDRISQFDPALFSILASEVPPDVWNDQTATVPPRKGLGPNVCQSLWKSGGYDQICDLIDHGVDTRLSSRASTAGGKGTYMGFVQPVQHIVAGFIRDVDQLENGESTLSGAKKTEVEGAKKIIDKLRGVQKQQDQQRNQALRNPVKGKDGLKKAKAMERDMVGTATDWSKVKDSELIDEFTNNPGTIWGFENVRLPYVQAAHETEEGAQPVRMLELWESVGIVTREPKEYEKLLDNPETAVKSLVDEGLKKIKAALKDPANKAKYADIEDKQKEFLENFERDATAFLKEFVGRMPKGTYAHNKPEGQKLGGADVAGIMGTSVMGAVACKAGLWWAKAEEKPVYYCLDGINMDDVTNYKKVKNAAIDDFISNGGKPGTEDAHREVITLVEVREILKNWDDLKDTVKFVYKGTILKPEDLKTKVAQWKKDMKTANDKAGRTPAPDIKTFTAQLNKIDTTLVDQLKDEDEGNMDARDIVKKHGYLVKVANTRPHIVIKYLMAKCEILMTYGLVSRKLPPIAAHFAVVDSSDDTKLRAAIQDCHADFRPALTKSLIDHVRAEKNDI